MTKEKKELSSEERRALNETAKEERAKKNRVLRLIRKGIWEDGFDEQFCYPKPYTICVITTKTDPSYTGVGVAKWNPNDDDNENGKWRYNKKSGERFSRPKAVANLAEALYETYTQDDINRVTWSDETRKFLEAMYPALEIDNEMLIIPNIRLLGERQDTCI